MPATMKTTPTMKNDRPSSFLSLMTGWVQQGVESFFATQRVLMDIAIRQNAMAMKGLREGLSDPETSPVAILTELAVEGTSSFIEAQRILLNLVQQENEIVLNGLKERVAGSKPAVAGTDLVRRTINAYVSMQQDFLRLTSKQTLDWLEAVKHGKGYGNMHLIDLAREAMEHFVRTQQKFLDIVSQESSRAMSGTPSEVSRKKTEVPKLVREATDAFVDAQKKLLDVMGQQMNVNLKAATHAVELLSPARLLPMANFTGEGVKSFMNSEKALIDSVIKPRTPVKPAPKPRAKSRARARTPKAKAKAAAA